MSDRRLPVFVPEWVIADGRITPPAVGDVVAYPLEFDEGPPGPLSSTLTVEVDPPKYHPPITPGPMRTAQASRWRTTARGDGWTAFWLSSRPVVGWMQVTGQLTYEDLAGARPVRARVMRIQVAETTVVRGDLRGIEGTMALRDVERTPREFADHAFDHWPRPRPAPGRRVVGLRAEDYPEQWRREIGVLVDLELGGLPTPALRPAFQPGDLSVHGDHVWVLDSQLPRAVRWSPTGPLTFSWDGPVIGHRAHAVADGCWITGQDGIRWCPPSGEVIVLDPRPVHHAATAGRTLASIVGEPGAGRGRRLLVGGPDGPQADTPWTRGAVRALTGDGDGFTVIVQHGEGHSGLVRLTVDGRVAAEIELEEHLQVSPPDTPPPLLIARRRGLRTIGPDLTLGPERPAPYGNVSTVWAAGGRYWVTGHGTAGYELAALHPTTLGVERRLPLPTDALSLGVTDDGTVWVRARGIRTCPPGADGFGDPMDAELAALFAP